MDNASALRRQLLAELRRLRPPEVLTQKQVADALDWSPSKVTRIENGSVSLSVTDLRALLAYYGVTDSGTVDGLVDLARRSRRARSPFAAFGDVFSPDALRFFDYEHSATWIGSIELLVVPGLLQTEHYARTLMGVHGVGAERVERFVSSRRVRQEVLDRPDPPTVSFIIDESVLLRAIGGRAVMRAQLEHLLEAAARPNLEIRIIPLALGEHVGLRGPFVLLRFSGTNDPDVVYIEQRRGDAIFQDEMEVIVNHGHLFTELEKRAASPDDLSAYVGRAIDRL
ncbi:MAG: helix-turn-helix domain-containing protein [Pseudonocardia sp.]|nr:helix-turn-helix domain-containing protein [Pseudonocardia sp.]